MENIVFKNANFKRVVYLFNPETGNYQKAAIQPEPYAVNAMPYELKRERTMVTKIKTNALEILTIRAYKKTNGSKKLLTGLEPLHHIAPNWFYGNHYRMSKGQKILSDILFHFSDDLTTLNAFYFSGFHKDNKELRELFAAQTIRLLIHLLK